MTRSASTAAVPRSRSSARWPPLTLIIGGTLGFVAVAADLMVHGWLAQCDGPLQYYFHQHSSYSLVLLFAAVSGLGQVILIGPIGVVVGAALLVQKKWRSTAAWALALIGSGILNAALKAFFHVPRPDRFTFYTFEPDSGYSFPSGHTMGVSIAAGALALVLLHGSAGSRARRRAALTLVVMLSLLEAFALLYLGVHYLTDVLGGLAVSAAWLGVIRWILPPAIAPGIPHT